MNAFARDLKPALPDAVDAECALLGAIMLNADAYWRVAGFLKGQHFKEDVHRLIYETMGTLISSGRSANPVTLNPYMPAGLMIGDITITAYLARLAAGAINVINAYDYARAIIEMWSRHQIIARMEDVIEMARSMPADMTPERIIGHAAGELTRIAQEGNERAGSTKYGVVLPAAVDKAAKDSDNSASRIPWFLPEIGQALGDIRRGNLIGLMSDSGGGKTSFSLQQCRFVAGRGFKSAFFSIEVTEEEAALQAAAQHSKISLGRIDNFTLNSKEKADLEAEMMASTDLPFYIVGFGECTLSDIRIKAEAMVKSHGLDLIVIDHAKMITLPNPKDMFAERINALYRGLKALAKTLNVAIVILIQRNDDWKNRWRSGSSIRPVMGDAYGGGSIKQSLDVWFSLYRPEPLYRELIPTMPPERARDGEKTKREVMIEKLEMSRGKAWVINHKRRRGEPGQSPEIRFDGEFTMFSSSSDEMPPAFEGF
ncbi:DnaB-like helicase C-terminal domain-containing protein [Mesorhizobium sp. YIM 152430]|uniref:DnaB-like helicase C-terminal domain-containing protein n=1 Tax=Mesorhizobium sp. YIM 152430 TaxID=3031761 RepID=UPI0023DC97E1|nr:DnaB-like helicase C-terminal domain-containing protein [Mesorhizobium sp. YIM 152430]MDF1599702.1 DnaB-like helicase C-terminal domain-containing protein [Mesorhizobium sp. YIM 152430]